MFIALASIALLIYIDYYNTLEFSSHSIFSLIKINNLLHYITLH